MKNEEIGNHININDIIYDGNKDSHNLDISFMKYLNNNSISERNRILDDRFFKKYIMYKQKYLELNGGLPLSKEERKIKEDQERQKKREKREFEERMRMQKEEAEINKCSLKEDENEIFNCAISSVGSKLFKNEKFQNKTYKSPDNIKNKEFIIKYLNNDRHTNFSSPYLSNISSSPLIDIEMIKIAVSKNYNSLSKIPDIFIKNKQNILLIFNVLNTDNKYIDDCFKLFCDLLKKNDDIDNKFIIELGKKNNKFGEYYFRNKSNIKELFSYIKDFKYCLKTIISNNKLYKYLNIDLRNDPKFNMKVFNYIKDEEIILKKIKKTPIIFEYLIPSLKNDMNLIIKAIGINPNIFQYINESLKSNMDFILKCINVNHAIFQFINESLKSNTDFILNAYNINNEIIKYLSKDIILKIITVNSSILQYMNEDFKKDPEFILKVFELVLKKDYLIFQHISEDLKNNREFVEKVFTIYKELVQNNSKQEIVGLIGDNLKKNKDFLLSILPLNGNILIYFDKILKEDKEIIYKAYNYIKIGKLKIDYRFKYLYNSKMMIPIF